MALVNKFQWIKLRKSNFQENYKITHSLGKMNTFYLKCGSCKVHLSPYNFGTVND